MSKLTLIRPPMVHPTSFMSFTKGIPPIGLAYVAGGLEKAGIEYDLIDAIGEGINSTYTISDKHLIMRGLTFDEILSRISFDAKYICLSCMFTVEWSLHELLIKRIKKEYPASIIILGGEHASSWWKQILSKPNFVDYCVIGEGDETFVELISNLEKGNSIKDLPGIALRVNNIPQLNSRRKRTKNVDLLYNSWKKFPLENYLNAKTGMNTVHLRAMPIMASRGCPYQCTFCSSPFMWGTDYFTRSPKSIVEEMSYLKKKYNVEHFDFTDLSATVNRKWTKELCERIIEADLGVSWQFGPGTRSEAFNEEILILLKKANLLKLAFAPESGSKETLEKIKKRINLEKLYKTIKTSVKIGLQTKCQFIMGMPGQSVKEMFDSAIFILKLALIGVDDIAIYLFYPYPGSEISNNLFKKELDASNIDFTHMVNTRIKNSNLPKEQRLHHSRVTLFMFTSGLMSLCYLIAFIRKPYKIYQIIHRTITSKPRRSTEMLLYMKLRNLFSANPPNIELDKL